VQRCASVQLHLFKSEDEHRGRCQDRGRREAVDLLAICRRVWNWLPLETDLTPNHHRTLQHAATLRDRQGARCHTPALGRLPASWGSRFADGRPTCAALPLRLQHLQCHRNRHHTQPTAAQGEPCRRPRDSIAATIILVLARVLPDSAQRQILSHAASTGLSRLTSAVIRLDACIHLFASLPRDLPISRLLVRHVSPTPVSGMLHLHWRE
jgi:hypothetical protein